MLPDCDHQKRMPAASDVAIAGAVKHHLYEADFRTARLARADEGDQWFRAILHSASAS